MKKMQPKIRLILQIISISLIVICIYLIARFHGFNQASMYYGDYMCDEKIYPYGCKLINESNQCFVMNCQAIGYNYNGAICSDFNLTRWYEKAIISSIGLVLTGCPTYIADIGINKYTCKENWKVNLLEENESCRGFN